MRPIIQYQGAVFQSLNHVFAKIGTFAEPLWIFLGLTYVMGLVAWAAWPFLRLIDRSTSYRYSYLAIVLIGLFVLRLPGLVLDEQNVDEGQWIASAATLVVDPRFWISVDGTTSGPFNVFPLMLPYYIGIPFDYSTLRLTGWFLALLPTVILVWATFRMVFREEIAQLALVPLAVGLAFCNHPDSIAYSSEYFPTVLLALALYLAARLWIGKLHLIGVIGLGMILGSVPYTKLQATPIALALTVGVLLMAKGRQVGGLVLGGIVPSVLIALYVWQAGIGEFFLRSFILANWGYAQSGSFHQGEITWLEKLIRVLPDVYGLFLSTRFFFACMPVIIAGGIRYCFWTTGPVQMRILVAFSVGWFLTAVYSTLQPGNRFAHYQILSFVPGFWLAGLVLAVWLDRSNLVDRVFVFRKRLVIVWTVLLGLLPGIGCLLAGNEVVRQVVVGPKPLPHPEVVERIVSYTRPNERLAVWGWHNRLHVETGLVLGTRFIPLYYPVIPGNQQAYFLRIYYEDLLTNRPEVIVDMTSLQEKYQFFAPERYPAIRNILVRNYQQVGNPPDIRIFVRKDRTLAK